MNIKKQCCEDVEKKALAQAKEAEEEKRARKGESEEKNSGSRLGSSSEAVTKKACQRHAPFNQRDTKAGRLDPPSSFPLFLRQRQK